MVSDCEASYKPGEAHGGAGSPPAAYGYLAEQISVCSHGEPLQERPGWELQSMGRVLWWNRRAGGAAAHEGQCLKGEPCGIHLCWSSAWRAAADRKPR